MALFLAICSFSGLGLLYWQIAEVTQRNAEIQNSLLRYQSEKEILERSISNLNLQKSDLDQDLRNSKIDFEKLRNNLNVLKNEQKIMETELDEKKKDINKLAKQEETAIDIIEDSKKTRELYNELSDENRSLQKSINENSVIRFNLKKEVDQLEIQLENLIKREEESQERYKVLSVDKENLRIETLSLSKDRDEISRLLSVKVQTSKELSSLEEEVRNLEEKKGKLLLEISENNTQNNQAISFLSLNKPLFQNLSEDLENIAKQKRELEVTLAGLKERENLFDKKHRDILTAIEVEQNRQNSINNSNKNLDEKRILLNGEIIKLEGNIQQLSNASLEISTQLQNNKENLASENGRLSALKENIEQLLIRKADVKTDVANLEKLNLKLLADISSNETKINQAIEAITINQPLVKNLSEDINSLTNQKRILENEIKDLRASESSLKNNTEELVKTIEEKKLSGIVLSNTINNLDKKRIELLIEVDNANDSIQNLKNEFSLLSIELQNTRENLASENARLATLKEIIFQKENDLNVLFPQENINEDVDTNLIPEDNLGGDE
jgi:chromosome segregation ATPase